ncbi:esterase/lipase family protein [Kitasatospora indigofera]|uniref:esterase/lipase family protein n=1 Tax=Kitasatospora indigofera TaxID=67307 RepID=UPI0036BE761B
MPANETLPVVYVRGFAGDTRGIDKAVADPFYGFNEGSTHIRVGAGNKPSFYQFESPLLRLLLDEGYEIRVQGGQEAYLDAAEKVPANTVWVHRFYDAAASSWGARPEEYRLENAAGSLLALIEKIRAKAGVPRVHLVAHSMGGLICRCLLQKILPERGEDPGEYVDKLFTYGTPHGGIAFEHGLGLLERLRDATGINGADIFGPERMYEYLTPAALQDRAGPPEGWDPRQMPGGFPPERVFCLVGTNPADYQVAMGLSSAVVGARSDGLVQIDNAYVPGAHRAYVHRSHSGSYGLVNSEEGYQNLRRFLFGDLRVSSALVGHRLPDDDQVEWQAEVRLSVRGLPIVMHEQTASHWCPVQLPRTRTDGGPERDVPLVTTFLCSRLAPREGAGPVRHALHLRVLSLRRIDGFLSFGDHLEQTADLDDILIVDVGSSNGAGSPNGAPGAPAGAAPATGAPAGAAPKVWAVWNSTVEGAIRDYTPSGPPLTDLNPAAGVWRAEIPLPETIRPVLGADARVALTVTPWN